LTDDLKAAETRLASAVGALKEIEACGSWVQAHDIAQRARAALASQPVEPATTGATPAPDELERLKSEVNGILDDLQHSLDCGAAVAAFYESLAGAVLRGYFGCPGGFKNMEEGRRSAAVKAVREFVARAIIGRG
jgi:hypothetical protein